MKIKGSTVVITGASSGIGRAAALRFAKEGANLVLAARRKEALEDVARDVRQHKVRALVVPTDVTDAEAVERLAERAAASFGGIDVWVNNAAVSVFGALHQTPVADFQQVLNVNVMGYVHGATSALKHFRRQKSGVLINVSSVVGKVPQPLTASYSASKAAVNSLSVSIRGELALDGLDDIHVVTVLPPTIDTPLFELVGNYTGKRVVPMPPVYPPQKVAEVILKAVKKPQNELPVGATATDLLVSHRGAPAKTEALMASNVGKKHLDHSESRPTTEGNLYEPAPYETAAVEGGWGGRRSHTVRKALGAGAGVAVAGGVAAVGAGVIGAKVIGKSGVLSKGGVLKLAAPKVIAAKVAYSGAKKVAGKARGRKK